jgi:phosphatidylcholine synthase
MERVWAWLVHAYTAAGVVLALLMVHFAYQGEVRTVLWLFLAAMVVDGTDGMLARRWRVKELVPEFDGALLDNIVDYITYAFAPMVLLWETGYLPDGVWGGFVAAAPLVASCYQFCRADAKTDDHFFLGFPSYWNIVAFYVVVFTLSEAATTAVLLALVVLVFVPVKYIYPSRTEKLWYTNMTLASLFLVLFGAITSQLPDVPVALTGLSLAYLAYYVAVSIWLTVRTGNPVASPAVDPAP